MSLLLQKLAVPGGPAQIVMPLGVEKKWPLVVVVVGHWEITLVYLRPRSGIH